MSKVPISRVNVDLMYSNKRVKAYIAGHPKPHSIIVTFDLKFEDLVLKVYDLHIFNLDITMGITSGTPYRLA